MNESPLDCHGSLIKLGDTVRAIQNLGVAYVEMIGRVVQCPMIMHHGGIPDSSCVRVKFPNGSTIGALGRLFELVSCTGTASPRETDGAYRDRMLRHIRSIGIEPNVNARILHATGAQLDDVGVSFGVKRLGSDLPTNAAIDARVRESDLPKNAPLPSTWTDAAKQVAALNNAARRHVGVDPAVPSKPSLRERLAREMRLDPIASDEVVFATAAKRLAGQYTALDLAVAVNKELRSRADAAQRKVESLLHDAAVAGEENDSLRAIVAEQELKLRKRK